MEKLLEVNDLYVAFPGKQETVRAMDGVSFQVFQGEISGLVDESDCDKSQTLRSILGLLKQPGRVTGDEIRYRGVGIAEVSQRELRRIRSEETSTISQELMTALNSVLRIHSQMYETLEGEKLSKEEKRRWATELLKLVDIPSPEARLDEYPHQLFSGICQCAVIAIVLGARPKLLLVDGLITALDVTIQDQIMKLLNQLKQELGMSITLVTRDLGIIAQICDRVAIMYAGQIVEMTDTVTLFGHPHHPYTYGPIGSLPNEEVAGTTLEVIKGLPSNLTHLPEGCPFSPRCKYTCDLCCRERPALTEMGPGHLARCHRLDAAASFQGLVEMPDGVGRREDTPHG